MVALSDFLELAILDEVCNGIDYVPPDTFVALYTTATDDAGGGTEVVGNGYARIQVNANSGGSPKWTLAAADGVASKADNVDRVDFPAASGGDWGTITHAAIRDAFTAGNLLFHGALAAPVEVLDGSQFGFAVGNLKLTTS